jgi:molybdopterin-containing oxidoreductase family membrane subunit
MSGCLFLRFAFLVSERQGLALTLGIIAAVAGVGANNNLGGLFTIASDPPIWFGPQLLILFLASAVLSGTAAIILFTVIAFRLRKQTIRTESFKALETAGTIMCLMITIVVVVTIARFWSMFYGSSTDPGRIAAQALVKGPLAINFWVFEILVGLLIPLVVLLVTKIKNIRAMTVAAVMVLTGAFVQRFDLVISGQIVPKLSGWNDLPEYFYYFPTGAEFIVVLGAFGLMGFGFLLGERFVGRLFRFH